MQIREIRVKGDVFIIGWDSAGSPFGIDTATGRVVVEDHNFSSIHELAPSLEEFMLRGVWRRVFAGSLVVSRPSHRPMWDIIKHKLGKLGCLFVIALVMIGATALTKVVLDWFHYDETEKATISNSVGEYVGKGLLGLVVLLGFILMGRQLVAELKGKIARPRVIPPPPMPPPIRREIRDFSSKKDDESDA